MNFKIAVISVNAPRQRSPWLFSWPLIIGLVVYLSLIFHGGLLLRDGDTYLHIATGRWIIQHWAVPTLDPFSHTMPGMPWISHEWLSAVILAISYDLRGWTGVSGISALAYAASLAILARALLRTVEPAHVILCVAFALAMTKSHLLARPHILAMPCMMLWSVGLVQASESGRPPRLWLLPVMTLWANLHGGFTLGLALIFAFALEALLNSKQRGPLAGIAKSWGLFTILAAGSSMVTPHGINGIFFTWQLLFGGTYALGQIGEWQSPNFQIFQPLELWLLGFLGLVIHHGLQLPPMRLLLLLGLTHLALKHQRNIDLLGLLAPVFVASPFALQWRHMARNQRNAEPIDRFFRNLAQPAGQMAVVATILISMSFTQLIAWSRAPQFEETMTPAGAIDAVRKAGISGPVLNEYGWGGYLIYTGIRPFIDGRADVYGGVFLKAFVEALALTGSEGLTNLLHKYKIEWTLLTPSSPAVTLLDHLPEWHRLYADKNVVVHVKSDISPAVAPTKR